MKSYSAVYVPNMYSDRCCSGFATEELAEEYIKDFLCSLCRKDLERGCEPEIPGCSDKWEIRSPLDTACGAEWIIISDEEYKEAIDDDKDIGWVFRAAGFTTSCSKRIDDAK